MLDLRPALIYLHVEIYNYNKLRNLNYNYAGFD